MTSAIDPTHLAPGVPASKAQARANWEAAKNEIEDLQERVEDLEKAPDGGAATFTGLGDTPSAILPLHYLRGDAGGTGLEFAAGDPGAADASTMSYSLGGTGAVTRTVKSKLDDVVSVRDFGATGNGMTNDAPAIQAAIDTGRSVYFPHGQYRLNSTLRIGTIGNQRGLMYFGAGPEQSVLRPQAGVDAFTITGEWPRVNIRDMGIIGTSDSGRGIYSPFESWLFESQFENMWIDTGSHGIELRRAFSITFMKLFVSSHNGHGISCEGAVGTTFIACYAAWIRSAGKAGFRSATGGTFVNCNGVNHGDYWGIFGGKAGDPDWPTLAYGNVNLYGCNIEDARVSGLRFVTLPRFTMVNTTFIAPASGTYRAHVEFDEMSGQGPFVPVFIKPIFMSKGATAQYECEIIINGGEADMIGIGMDDNRVYRTTDQTTRRFNVINSRGVMLPRLPNSDPGGGTGALWVDTANGNVLRQGT